MSASNERLRAHNRRLAAVTKEPPPGRRDKLERLLNEALERRGSTKYEREKAYQRRGFYRRNHFHNCNLHVVSGSGATAATNGKGNIVIGYCETGSASLPSGRMGSSNLILGYGNSFATVIVNSNDSVAAGPGSTVVSGGDNSAYAPASCILGGFFNVTNASANDSALLGGYGQATNNPAEIFPAN